MKNLKVLISFVCLIGLLVGSLVYYQNTTSKLAEYQPPGAAPLTNQI